MQFYSEKSRDAFKQGIKTAKGTVQSVEMREEVEKIGLRISEILNEKGNPHQRVEITQEGVKIVSADSFMPNK